MKAYKRTPKSVIATLKSFQGLATSFALLLAACGGDSGSGAKGSEPAEGADDGREVATLVDMGRCTSEREGDTVYVAEKLTDYLCKNKTWVDLSEISSDMSSGKTDSDTKSSSSKVTGSTDETDPSSSDSDTDTPEGFVRENISVMGVAQKGPFKFGSPLNLYELKKNLTPSGTVYKDEISSNKGDFVIPKVSLAYPYAKLEVRGLYRNEVTGEWSTDSMTLRALTDFSEKRTEVNINLLTHLEYDRALYLVQNKGYSVYAAKKQAAQEIMTAFEFATAVTYSEDFAIFQNEGVSANTLAGNSSLLAISALVMGNRNDAEIQSVIDKFREDIKTDGEWNDLQTKATMADWAYDFDYSTIRASVKSWNILDIPAYETYLDIYWNNVYGLGGCSVNRKDVVAPNSNKLSKNYNKYFICNGSHWDDATTYEKDTYKWSAGKSGEFKKGNVTDTIYVYNGTEWEVAERETAIGLCQNSNAGVVSKFDDSYYICKNNAWGAATALEYDTYGWLSGEDGEMRAGNVNVDTYYVCLNGKWISPHGSLTDSRDGKIYRTVVIGTQMWMAENLNLRFLDSWCYKSDSSYCNKHGRLYSWSTVMDAAGTFSTNSKNCGYYGEICSPTYPVRGICPEGWHLPDSTEWEKLFTAVGGQSIAGKMLKSTNGWYNGTDAYGFSAFVTVYRRSTTTNVEYIGDGARFWSASGNGNLEYYVALVSYSDAAVAELSNVKNYGFSVRCLRN